MTEPMTALTDVILAGVAFVLGVRLAYPAAADGVVSSTFVALGFFATAASAALAAVAHASDPHSDFAQRRRFWRGALIATCFVGAAIVAAVAYFAARGTVRSVILVVAGLELVTFLVRVARRPEFRVAAMGSASALAFLAGGAVYAYVRWRAPGMLWIVAAVVVSLVGLLVQAGRVAPHRRFNHNELFHVIEAVALYLLYRGGAVLVDR